MVTGIEEIVKKPCSEENQMKGEEGRAVGCPGALVHPLSNFKDAVSKSQCYPTEVSLKLQRGEA